MSRAQNRQTTVSARDSRRKRPTATAARPVTISPEPFALLNRLFAGLPPLEQSAATRLAKAMYASNYEAVLAALNVSRDPTVVDAKQDAIYAGMVLHLSDQLMREAKLIEMRRTVEHALHVEPNHDRLRARFFRCLLSDRLTLSDGADAMLAQAHRVRHAAWAQIICETLSEARRWELLLQHRPATAADDALGREALLGNQTWEAALAEISEYAADEPVEAIAPLITRVVRAHAQIARRRASA